MPLEVRAEVNGVKPRALADADRGELARPDQRVHGAPRDPKDARDVGDRQQLLQPIRVVPWRLEMCAHDFIVRQWSLDGTSAEPDLLGTALRVCSETVLADRAGSIGEWSMNDVRQGALRIEQAAQNLLQHLGGVGTAIPLQLARRVHDAQWQAHEAVYATTGSRAAAKAIQARAAANRRPLTVCVGNRYFRFRDHDTVIRFNAPDLQGCHVPLGAGDGCGQIILDSSQPRQPKKDCERCRARRGSHPRRHGKAKTALAKLRRVDHDERLRSARADA
jgi:hypothetical protein